MAEPLIPIVLAIFIFIFIIGKACVQSRRRNENNANEDLGSVRQEMSQRRQNRPQASAPPDTEEGQMERVEAIKNHLFSRKIESPESVRTIESLLKAAEERYEANTEGNKLSRSYRAASSSTRTLTSKPECVICLDEYESGETICWAKTDECDHIFHEECAIAWLKDHDDCPLCRADIMNFDVPASNVEATD